MESSGGSSGGANTNYLDLAKQTLQLQKDANQPAIESIQKSIPTTEAAFAQKQSQLEGQRAPLKTRYDNLLAEVTRREGVDTQQTNIATAREYGKRGIPLSSGAYDEALIQKQRPISEYYGGQYSNIGLEGANAEQSLESLIANLPIEKQGSLDAINQAIGQLQSGGAASGIAQALQLYQTNQQANQAQSALALQQQVANSENAYRQAQISQLGKTQSDPYANFLKLGEGDTLFNLDTLQKVTGIPKTYKGTGGSGW